MVLGAVGEGESLNRKGERKRQERDKAHLNNCSRRRVGPGQEGPAHPSLANFLPSGLGLDCRVGEIPQSRFPWGRCAPFKADI